MVTVHCYEVKFENIQAIVFDKDGTLANSESFLRSLAQRRSRLIDAQIPGVQEPLLMAFGIEGDRLNPGGLMAVGSRSDNEIAAAAYVAETGRGWIESLEIVHSAFAEADKYLPQKANHTPPIPGVVDLLHRLSKYSLKLGILSSDTTDQVKDFLQTYGLEPYFHSLFGVDRYKSKSDPQLLQQLFSTLNVSPRQTIMIGDSQLDLQIANQAAMAGFIAIVNGWTTPPQLPGATVTINQFDQVKILEDC